MSKGLIDLHVCCKPPQRKDGVLYLFYDLELLLQQVLPVSLFDLLFHL